MSDQPAIDPRQIASRGRPLLDILTEHRTLPDGYDAWGMRAVHPDFRSSYGFRWPFPGQVAQAAGPFARDNTGPCPASVGDGVCTAQTAAGMASGGIPAVTVLLTAHKLADVLGFDNDKVRASQVLVVDVVDLPRLCRESMTEADLCGANLYRANLYRANLEWANLYGANLCGANLYRADLCGANLEGADLRVANLTGADLEGANLYGANLEWADLTGADLTGADLCGADLTGARSDKWTTWPDGFDADQSGVRS